MQQMTAIVSKRPVLYGLLSLFAIWTLALVYPGTVFERYNVHASSASKTSPGGNGQSSDQTILPDNATIKDKVAMITDTLWTPRLLPLILHYHAVLGSSWPIVFFTSQEMYDEHLSPTANETSASWQDAVDSGAISVRMIDSRFTLTSREGVNDYLADAWLWEQLAPAKNVLVFQADSMICANSPVSADEFLQYGFVGATFSKTQPLFNGGLSMRNRELLLDIIREDDWPAYKKSKTNGAGEDLFFSRKSKARGANLPNYEAALRFAQTYPGKHLETGVKPLGYHKVHKVAPSWIPRIREWCPEIDLAAAGVLAQP